MAIDKTKFLPERHPRYSQEPVVELADIQPPPPAHEAEVQVKSKAKRSPETRALFNTFYDRFKEIHGYQYPGEWVKDTMMIQKLLGLPGIDGYTVRQMMDIIFDEHKGFWNKVPATVSVMYYDRSRSQLIDQIKKRETMREHKQAQGDWLVTLRGATLEDFRNQDK